MTCKVRHVMPLIGQQQQQPRRHSFHCLSCLCSDSPSPNYQTPRSPTDLAAVRVWFDRKTHGLKCCSARYGPSRAAAAARQVSGSLGEAVVRGRRRRRGHRCRRHSTTETRGDQFITAQRVVNKPVPFFPLLAHFVTIYDLRTSRSLAAVGSCRRCD